MSPFLSGLLVGLVFWPTVKWATFVTNYAERNDPGRRS